MFRSWNSHHLHYNKHLCTQHAMHLFGFLHSFYPHNDKLSLSAHGFSCGCWDWCELQGQKLLSVPDWICWRRESFGIVPEDSPSHSLPLFLYTKQHSAEWHTKHQKCQKSCWCLSVFHLLSVFLRVFGALVPARPNAAYWTDHSHVCMHKLNF